MVPWIFVLAVLASSPVLTAVVDEQTNDCRFDEFSCDGRCLSMTLVCDGHSDCLDGSDEALCSGNFSSLPSRNTSIRRSKRQSQQCRKTQWKCRDGSCISFDGKCDGVVDCPDGSDETHALCRKSICQSNWFRCTYGACVDGNAACNGVRECADNSDELLPRCRNENDEVRGQFTCADGQKISAAEHCDGVADCADGSDETVRACAGKTCPAYLFQCAYGACVDQGADCNGLQECADNSDESDELCNRTSTQPPNKLPSGTGNCILPPFPDHGRYTVGGVPQVTPGQKFESFQINVTCNAGYGVIGNTSLLCINGFWSSNMPACVHFCQLSPHPSVEYFCDVNENGIEGTRPCGELEPSGTIVTPRCQTPNYYFPGVLNKMHCINGNWDYIAKCNPECGRITPTGTPQIIDGRPAELGELPWHTGIYRKTTTPYMQICGGSLVSTTVVISAAHCFWSDVKNALPASDYAIAVGKIYRPWNSPKDLFPQKSDVSDIKIPRRFQGATANYQEDIAIVILVTAITYKTYVRPVCVDFDVNFDKQQLQPGRIGKVAGWGLTAEDGSASPFLQVVEIPYVDVGECIARSPPGFREYITSDKICAGWGNGTALCKGDSGGGLVLADEQRGIERYYLRGVVSTAPTNEHACNKASLTSFTHLAKHEQFIKEHVRI